MAHTKTPTFVIRVVAALVAVTLFGVSVWFSQQTEGQEVGTGTGLDMGFGVGGAGTYGVMTPADYWVLDPAGMNLTHVDPITGGIIGDATAGDNAGFGAGAAIDLMQTGQLAIDLAELARKAEEIRLRKLAEAQRSGRGVAVKRAEYGYPEEWELDNFSTCGAKSNAQYRARIETVLAFEELCRAAEADGVNLVIVSAYRSIEHQRRLWNQKLKEVGGNEALARKWVAPPGKSNHQRGIAIDLSIMTGDPKAKEWIHRAVGCYSPPDNLRLGVTKCSSGEEVVKQVQLYGFILPMSWEPWHIELGVPIPGTEGAPGGGKVPGTCDPDRSLTVQEMIGAIFRCRLTESGYSAAEQDKIVSEALVIAKCESGFNTHAKYAGGRWADTPNPKDGRYYTAAGVFQFIKVSANNWIQGGYANVHDPVANIDGAARYYIAERKAGREGWGPWECRKDLPQYGGPAIPSWAKQY